jgi:hypothetical protein
MVRDIVPGSGKLEFPVPMHLAYSPILASKAGKKKRMIEMEKIEIEYSSLPVSHIDFV